MRRTDQKVDFPSPDESTAFELDPQFEYDAPHYCDLKSYLAQPWKFEYVNRGKAPTQDSFVTGMMMIGLPSSMCHIFQNRQQKGEKAQNLIICWYLRSFVDFLICGKCSIVLVHPQFAPK